jgi:hypothetical protein
MRATTSWTIGLLIVATAVIHFSRAVADPEIRALFILNGLGYLGLGTLLFLPQLQRWQRWIRRILIGYTAVTVLLYGVWGLMSGDWSFPLGPIDKLIEIGLIAALWQAERQSPTPASAQSRQ